MGANFQMRWDEMTEEVFSHKEIFVIQGIFREISSAKLKLKIGSLLWILIFQSNFKNNLYPKDLDPLFV